ncbi:dihydropteroate synthase [uncultured Phascolarctobacterium sp.]|mgnify:CR=1 FL=1|uniref:dihydropteroate synthase n=1 Tax=uncultured Phascolarctobacterium sp. TaxID=512296 RepID=UPI0025E7AE05|nr:dihydropteroate synthase [uncultured Phascolarctobacterium sp.]
MLLKINRELLPEAIGSVGANAASLPIFANKSEILPYKLAQVRTPAANILKQEMLAAAGDAVVPAGCIVNAAKYVDVVLLGTRKHYALLLRKLALMPYFGLQQIAEELQAVLQPAPLFTTLADGRRLTYEQLCVMGILNITPDSFYAGSRVPLQDVVERAGRMLNEGAGILDIGGESTRPGSDSVDAEEERRRVVPVITELRRAYPQAVLSIDTYRAATAALALAAGADIINDISAMEADPQMLEVAVRNNAPIILMHMRGTPKNMQQNCEYQDVVQEVAVYLAQRAQLLRDRGVGADKIILDPGIGFAKNAEQNLLLLRDLHTLTSFGYPVLLAASRKSTIGAALGGLPPEERLEGTIATSLQAVYAGAQLVRVHDVKENVRAIRMLEAIKMAGGRSEDHEK